MKTKAPFTDARLRTINVLVSDEFRVHLHLLTERGRTANLALARQTAMFLARETLTEIEPFTNLVKPLSHPRIAALYNRGDHGTSMHACKVVEENLRDPVFLARVNALRTKITSELSKQPQPSLAQ